MARLIRSDASHDGTGASVLAVPGTGTRSTRRQALRATLFRAALCAVLPASAPLVAIAAVQADPAPATNVQPASPPADTGTPTGAEHGHGRMAERFAAADTNHDGHLTLGEAQAAGLKGVVRHFDAIDTTHQGYVTLDQIRAYRHAQHQSATPGASMDGSPS